MALRRAVRRFLFSWYSAVEQHATGTTGPEVQLRAHEGATDLINRLVASPALHDLTVNPLLLTMIANVHRYRASLPGSRADLYGEVCQVMLWRRQEAKHLDSSLPGGSKERLLAQLAYVMMSDRIRDIQLDRLLEVVRPGLQRISDAVTPKDFVADVGSNGLLIEREADLYAFAHLTFQEFLAAKHMQEQHLGDVLVHSVDDGWWRETILLYCAGADADPIMRACLASGTAQAVSLAFACTEVGAEVAPSLRSDLNRILALAFRDDGAARQRRVVAGVLAARHLRRMVSTPGGGRVCLDPVPTGLYWLFLQDTGRPQPDGGCRADPESSMPVRGAWPGDVAAFLQWLDVLDPQAGTACRLPTVTELAAATAAHGATGRTLAGSINCAWALDGDDETTGRADSPLTVWYTDRPPQPPTVTTAELITAVTRDVLASRLLPALQRRATVALVGALAVRRNRSLAYASALARLFANARSALSDPDNYGPARKMVPELTARLRWETTVAQALDRMLAMAGPLVMDHELAQDLDRTLTQYGHQELAELLVFSSSMDRDLSIAAQWMRDYGLGAANGFARTIDQALRRARERLAAVKPLVTPPAPSALEKALALDGLLRQPDSDAGGAADVLTAALGRGPARALEAALYRPDRETQAKAFADALVRGAGLPTDSSMAVSLDDLVGVLRRLRGERSPVARRLLPLAGAVFAREHEADSSVATMLRIPALALATDAGRGPTSDDWCAVAFGICVLADRLSHRPALETIVLVRA